MEVQSCQPSKINRKPIRNPLEITTSTQPFENIYINLIGPLPVTINENKYILTIMNDLTKFYKPLAEPEGTTPPFRSSSAQFRSNVP